MATLNTDIRYIKGVGEARAKSLAKLGITDLRSLLSSTLSSSAPSTRPARLNLPISTSPTSKTPFTPATPTSSSAVPRVRRAARR